MGINKFSLHTLAMELLCCKYQPTMKSPVIFDITAVVIFSLVICCSSSGVTDESVFKEEGDVGKRPTAATVDNFRNGEGTKEHFDIVGSGGEDALFHGFTHEEIEKNRIITIDRDGNERVSTDEEVVQTLKRARQCNSTILRDEPHFSTQMKRRRDVIGPDNRFLRYINTASSTLFCNWIFGT